MAAAWPGPSARSLGGASSRAAAGARGAPDLPAGVRRHARAGRCRPRGCSTSRPPLFGALAWWTAPVARRALVAVRAGAAVVLGDPRRRLARDARGALPLLRDGRRARALRGVVGVPAGDQLRRASSTASWARSRHASSPTTTARGAGPRSTALFVAALAVANLISWRANEGIRGATGALARSASGARSTTRRWRWRWSPRTGALLQANRELRERTGHGGAEGLHFWDLVPADDRAELRASWPPESDGPETERRYVRADGSIGWILWRHSLIRDADGRPDHYISQGVDITARKRDAERLDHQAHHDPLTGLPNRALFDRVLADALERRARDRQPARGPVLPTSTTSRSSTTRSATAPATSCWSRSRSASARCCARTTRSPASAATSS